MAQAFTQGDDAILKLTFLDSGGSPIDLSTMCDAVAALFDSEGNKLISFSLTSRVGYYTLALDTSVASNNVINCFLMREQSVGIKTGVHSMSIVVTIPDASAPDDFVNTEYQFSDFTCRKGWLVMEVMHETLP